MKLVNEGSDLELTLQFTTAADLVYIADHTDNEFYIRNGDLYITERGNVEE